MDPPSAAQAPPRSLTTASENSLKDLFDLPLDALRLIFSTFLEPHERLTLRFVHRRLSSLDVLSKDKGKPLVQRAFGKLVEQGNLSLLKWFHAHVTPSSLVLNRWNLSLAALGGHLEVLKWMRENGCPWDEEAFSFAAGGGHLEVLKWLREKGCPWNERTWQNANHGGHIEVLNWLRANRAPQRKISPKKTVNINFMK